MPLSRILRRGWTTSEFWVCVLAIGLVAIARPHTTAATLSVAAIASSYAISRGLVKGRAARRILDAVDVAEELPNEPRGPRRVS